MNQKELSKLSEVLHKLELDTIIPYRQISGGFAKAEMYNFDDDTIDVELVYGVQSDVQNMVYSENLELDRKTFEFKN
jgi:hypothetical protein